MTAAEREDSEHDRRCCFAAALKHRSSNHRQRAKANLNVGAVGFELPLRLQPRCLEELLPAGSSPGSREDGQVEPQAKTSRQPPCLCPPLATAPVRVIAEHGHAVCSCCTASGLRVLVGGLPDACACSNADAGGDVEAVE